MAQRNTPKEINPKPQFSMTSKDRKFILVIIDLVALNSGFLFSMAYRPDYDLNWKLVIDNPVWFLLLNGLWFFWGYLFQIFNLEKACRVATALFPIVSVGFLTLGTFILVPYLPPSLPPSRSPLFITLIAPVVGLLLGRTVFLLVFGRAVFRQKVLILGAGGAGRTICQAFLEHAQATYEVVGFIDDDPEKFGSWLTFYNEGREEQQDQKSSFPVLGPSSQLLEIIAAKGVTMIVLSITHDVSGELYQTLTDSLQLEVEVVPMPLLHEQITGKVPVEHIGDHWSVAMPLEQLGTRLIWHAGKRIFDIFWSVIGLLLLGLLYPFIALAIKLDSAGPILYTQKRMGRHGKQFRVFKFRSMVEDAEKDQAVWAKKDDPRATRVGNALRRTHLDEFPQFWNIFKGEMSVVGPRPERPEFINELAEEIPFYRVRLAVKPGMAGWALIHQGYGASKDDALIKLQYDLYYIKHQSLWLDFYILWRTIIEAVTFRGR
jgi:exopolysaccharide biosynthesis polyprenyl glycosylphosphotransferase